MQRYLRILIVFCVLSPAALAQNADRFAFYNAKVYMLTLQEKWDSVLFYCDRAKTENIESYEIFYGQGKAFFFTGKYRKAWTAFNSAAAITNPGAELKSFLYYSAQYSGMNNQTRFWRFSMSGADRNKFNAGAFPLLEGFGMGSSIGLSSNAETNGANEYYPLEPISFDSSYYKMTDNLTQLSASASFGFCKRVGLFVSISSLQSDDLYRLAYIEYAGAPLMYVNFPASTSQQAIYAAIPVLLNSKTTLVPSAHIVSIQSTTFHEGLTAGSAILADTALSEHLLSFSIIRDLEKSSHEFSFSWSDFSLRNQVQASFRKTWYPQYNLNEYYSFGITGQRDGRSLGFAVSVSGGWKINRFVWLESSLRLGKLSNFSDENGWGIYNISDYHHVALKVNPTVLITPKLSLSFQYNGMLNRLPFALSTESSGHGRFSSSNTINTSYLLNNFTGGIIWKL